MNKKNLITIFIISLFIIISYLPSETEAGCCAWIGKNDKYIYKTSTTETEDQCKDSLKRGEILEYDAIFYKDKIAKDDECIDSTITKEIKKADPIKYNPQISIPESEFTAGKTIEIPASARILANYVIAIFKYLIGVVGIIAAIVLMFAGIRWLTASGNQAAIGEAKKYIFSSLTGLTLALGSFLLLSTINTNLVNLQVPEIQYIDYAPMDSLSNEEYNNNIEANPAKFGPAPEGEKKAINELINKNISYSYTNISNIASNLFKVFPVLASNQCKVFYQCWNPVRNIDYSANGTCTEGGKITNNENGSKYGINNASTICTSGCGLVALYNFLNCYGLAGDYETEIRSMVKYAEDNKQRFHKQGTKQSTLIGYAKNKKGLNSKILKSFVSENGGIEKAFLYVQAGYPVIASVGPSKFTKGGHFIVLYKAEGETMYVLDSANPKTKGDGTPNENYKPTRDFVTKQERSELPWNTLTVFYQGKDPDPEDQTKCKKTGEKCEQNSDCCNETACYYDRNNKRYQCSSIATILLNQYGCSFTVDDCDSDLKCLFDGSYCNSSLIEYQRCHRCSDSCIGDDQFGCHQNNDCCSKKCNTNNHKCMPANYGCNFKNLTPCTTGKCLFDGARCNANQINNKICHRCINACIGDNQFGCHKNDDCCSNKCNNNTCYR